MSGIDYMPRSPRRDSKIWPWVLILAAIFALGITLTVWRNNAVEACIARGGTPVIQSDYFVSCAEVQP